MKQFQIIGELKKLDNLGNNKFWQEHNTYCNASTLKSAKSCKNKALVDEKYKNAHIIDMFAYCDSNKGIDKIYDFEVL